MLDEIQIVIIDEIPMVSNITFLHIHQRLCEIFGYKYNKPFARKTVLVVGDYFSYLHSNYASGLQLLMVHLEICLVYRSCF